MARQDLALLANHAAKMGAEKFTKHANESGVAEETINEVLSMAFPQPDQEKTAMQQALEAAAVHIPTHTRIEYQSDLLKNSFIYAIERAGRSYLKAKNAAIRAKGAYQEQAINDAKTARAAFMSLVQYAPADWTPDNVVLEFCGMGREWNASGKMVSQFAQANGVDEQLAIDLVSRQMTVAQDYAQATRGNQFGLYLNWLASLVTEAETDGAPEPEELESILQDAYKRAAQWNLPADGLLIKEFAQEIGCSECLPNWADNLKANMPTPEQAAAARQRIAKRAEAQAAQAAEQEDELRRRYGDF